MKSIFNRCRSSALAAIFVFISVALSAQPYNTNALDTPLVDINGFFAWPIDPVADSFTGTNYNGGGWSATIGGSRPLTTTNTYNDSSFFISTNGHFTILDQYGTKLHSGTNGVLEVLETNGVDLLISNGNLTITSNGLPYGTVNVASLIGNINPTNLPSLTNYTTRTEWLTGSNVLSTNLVNLYTNNAYGTNWLYTNWVNQLSIGTNFAYSNLVVFMFNMSNVLNTAIGTSGFNGNGASNALQLQINTNLTYLQNVSNTVTANNSALAAAIIATNNQVTTDATNLANALTNLNSYTSNKLQVQITTLTLPQTKSLDCTLPSTFSSQGVAFNTPLMPDGNFSVVLFPNDATTATYPPLWWITAQNASGFTVNIPVQTNFNLNFHAIIVEHTQ